ncbi:ABC transporter permease [Marispirochaeta sp.]|jgi:inositol transport system permease protein|uniref:ABC transporter permease n=1 Tax=Marispirochaeta sp. TaxID=2038653 RepID=UPI0029C7BEAC|nr:ABC transporter permease [Marispirochaeta sp.]
MAKNNDVKIIRESLSVSKFSILIILIGIALLFEALGWFIVGRSFLLNPQRLFLMILQVSVIGIIAIGVTQIIIAGGIDLSSGSVVALVAVVAASFAQAENATRPVFENMLGIPVCFPVLIGLTVGALCGLINGILIAKTKIPPFIATLGMMVSARGMAQLYTEGKPVSMLTDSFNFIGNGPGGIMPVIIYLCMAAVVYYLLTQTRYGKYVYAIGGNEIAARVSGVNVERYKIAIYTFAGFLSGLAGIVLAARINSGQSGMGVSFELDAIAAAVIGGASLSGGLGTIPGTIVGSLVLGIVQSGFTFLRVNAYIQEIIKGMIIVGAVVMDVMRNKQKT